MSSATVITEGYGSFGSVAFVITEGYGAYGVVTPTPTVTPTVTTGSVGVGGRAWRDHYARKKLPKKKRDLLDELDDVLLELRSRIEEEPPEEVEPEWVAELRKAEHFADSAITTEFTLAEFTAQLALAQQMIREIDDEDAILLAIH